MNTKGIREKHKHKFKQKYIEEYDKQIKKYANFYDFILKIVQLLSYMNK